MSFSICVSIALSSILRKRVAASDSIGLEHFLEVANFIYVKILPIIISIRTKWKKKHLIHPYKFRILFRIFLINDMKNSISLKVYIYISMDDVKYLDGMTKLTLKRYEKIWMQYTHTKNRAGYKRTFSPQEL